jgi:four helix bundle protein
MNMAEAFGFEKLDVWQLGMRLAKRLYEATASFPKEESFGLTSQARRAAVSIPSNIAEGYGLSGGNFHRHLQIAIGSVYELRTQLQLAEDLGFGSGPEVDALREKYCRLGRMLHGLVKSRSSAELNAASL